MCVHRTRSESSHDQLKVTTSMSRKMKKCLRYFLKEGKSCLVIYIVLNCLIQGVKCSPLMKDPGGGGGGGHLRLVANPEGVDPSVPSGSAGKNFISGFISSLSMIIVSELGDKTFFIAAVMAMKYPRLTVFSGAMTALAFMTVLSAAFGYVTTFIPRVYTYYVSTALFAIFGFKMLYDGVLMSPDEGAEELEEVHLNIRQREEDENTPLTASMSDESLQPGSKKKVHLTLRRLLTSCFSKVYIQALTMTFLAEWGDRSQLATVVLAARENIFGICFGGVLGHSLCTGLAVIGGRMIAQKISVKTVTIIGGFVFLGFAVVSLFLDPNN